MDWKELFCENEKPLDNLLNDGGFCGIFQKIAVIGDSLSSGEFETIDSEGKKSYHDKFEYSWGQYIAKATGAKVYNFSKGGMTAKTYVGEWANQWGFFDNDKLCQAYIIALGVNDVSRYANEDDGFGSYDDIDFGNWENTNIETFIGSYASIIQRLKQNQPKAKFFLMTAPRESKDTEKYAYLKKKIAEMLNKFADMFEYTYVLDFWKYAPVYDDAFREKFNLGGHMNPMGYMLTAKMVMSYMDYIIRHNMEDFKQVGLIGTPYYRDYKIKG